MRRYNLTQNQKALAKDIVELVRAGKIEESFAKDRHGDQIHVWSNERSRGEMIKGNEEQLEALEQAQLILIKRPPPTQPRQPGQLLALSAIVGQPKTIYTLLGSIYKAVDSNFAEPEESAPVSTLAHAIPPELNLSLDRLRRKYPDPSKTGFLIMRFTKGKPFDRIVKAIQKTGEELGLSILRADQNEFHADLWGNVRTHLEACSFGIAVYERIDQGEPNANVGLEVGYLLAQNKPVLLLKEKTVKALQADLMGKLYKQFDEHDPQGTIPEQLTTWLKDYGIVL